MPTRAQVGLSNARSPAEASTEAVSAAVAALGAAPQLAVVFATAGYDQTRLLASVRGALGPGCQVVGCTGEGVIGNAASFENDHAVMVMAIALEGSTADVHLVDSYASDPKGAAHALADQVGRTDDMIGLLLFPDGLGGNCSEFLAVLSAARSTGSHPPSTRWSVPCCRRNPNSGRSPRTRCAKRSSRSSRT